MEYYKELWGCGDILSWKRYSLAFRYLGRHSWKDISGIFLRKHRNVNHIKAHQ